MSFKALFTLFAFVSSSVLWSQTDSPPVGAYYTEAPHVILYDFDTGTVLFEKGADAQMVPSSLTKVLLIHLVFKKLQEGELTLDQPFAVSEKAWKMGGSRTFLNLGNSVPLHELIQGVVVQSGNDAACTIAEGIAGTERACAELMNKEAARLGAKGTNFLNTTGWPENGHLSTARDILLFGVATIRDFPEFYTRYYPQKEFTHNNIRQHNRNPLVQKNLGDGLKTGQTESGGFGLLGSAVHNGRRIVFVINGLKSDKERRTEAMRLREHGLHDFKHYVLFKKGETIAHLPVEGGSVVLLPVIAEEDVVITVPRTYGASPSWKIETLEGVKAAPFKQGEKVIKLYVEGPLGKKDFWLVAAQDVPKAGGLRRLWRWIKWPFTGAPSKDVQIVLSSKKSESA